MRRRDIDRAVIDRQRQLLSEKDEQIQALEVELEATQALVNAGPDAELLAAWQQLACVYRAHRDFLRAQVQLALELLEAKGILS